MKWFGSIRSVLVWFIGDSFTSMPSALQQKRRFQSSRRPLLLKRHHFGRSRADEECFLVRVKQHLRIDPRRKKVWLQTGVDGVGLESRKCENRFREDESCELEGVAKCCFFTQKVINSDLKHKSFAIKAPVTRQISLFSSFPGCFLHDHWDFGESHEH